MLADARAAVADANNDLPSGSIAPPVLLTASKALNRAGGFLEAISLTQPELGLELIEEFEAFAAEVDALTAAAAIHADDERRATTGRRLTNDRRGWDRRLGRERRYRHIRVLAERRSNGDRRTRDDRRTGHARELADRRFRSLAN